MCCCSLTRCYLLISDFTALLASKVSNDGAWPPVSLHPGSFAIYLSLGCVSMSLPAPSTCCQSGWRIIGWFLVSRPVLPGIDSWRLERGQERPSLPARVEESADGPQLTCYRCGARAHARAPSPRRGGGAGGGRSIQMLLQRQTWMASRAHLQRGLDFCGMQRNSNQLNRLLPVDF